jgi:hypothetical protein
MRRRFKWSKTFCASARCLASVTRVLPPPVSGDLALIAANVHAAPPTRTFLACVKEVNDAGFALANTR